LKVIKPLPECDMAQKFIKEEGLIAYNMGNTVPIRKDAISDLLRMKEEFDTIVESIELMSDEKFMASMKRSKEQIEKRQFADWHEL
jgi:hypothetical protein